jgi:NTP pyrophosphatase (non-canonical NTP hydrolase)
MEFQGLIERARQIREKYADFEQQRYGRSWTREEIALGFMGDVGDLMKLLIAQNGVRAIPDADAKLAHELADCLWAVIVLADLYDVDLEKAYVDTMNDLEQHLRP